MESDDGVVCGQAHCTRDSHFFFRSLSFFGGSNHSKHASAFVIQRTLLFVRDTHDLRRLEQLFLFLTFVNVDNPSVLLCTFTDN